MESQAVENEAQLEVNCNLPCPSSKFKQCNKGEHLLQAFLLKHGENMVDCLGAEVDRIEKNLKQKHPEVLVQILIKFGMLVLLSEIFVTFNPIVYRTWQVIFWIAPTVFCSQVRHVDLEVL